MEESKRVRGRYCLIGQLGFTILLWYLVGTQNLLIAVAFHGFHGGKVIHRFQNFVALIYLIISFKCTVSTLGDFRPSMTVTLPHGITNLHVKMDNSNTTRQWYGFSRIMNITDLPNAFSSGGCPVSTRLYIKHNVEFKTQSSKYAELKY